MEEEDKFYFVIPKSGKMLDYLGHEVLLYIDGIAESGIFTRYDDFAISSRKVKNLSGTKFLDRPLICKVLLPKKFETELETITIQLDTGLSEYPKDELVFDKTASDTKYWWYSGTSTPVAICDLGKKEQNETAVIFANLIEASESCRGNETFHADDLLRHFYKKIVSKDKAQAFQDVIHTSSSKSDTPTLVSLCDFYLNTVSRQIVNRAIGSLFRCLKMPSMKEAKYDYLQVLQDTPRLRDQLAFNLYHFSDTKMTRQQCLLSMLSATPLKSRLILWSDVVLPIIQGDSAFEKVLVWYIKRYSWYNNEVLMRLPRTTIILLLQNGTRMRLIDLSMALRADPQFLLGVFRDDQLRRNLIMTLDDVRVEARTKEVVIQFVQQDGYNLEYAPAPLQGDPDVVKAAILQNGDALKFASDYIKNRPFWQKMADDALSAQSHCLKRRRS